MSRIEDIAILLLILAIVGGFGGLVVLEHVAPQEKDYTYHVKAQQAYDVSRVESDDVTAFENLSGTEKELMYRAFKKSDHFMGTSEVRIQSDEQLTEFQGWRSIEVNGVVMVIAVDEEIKWAADNEWAYYDAISTIALASFAYMLLASFWLILSSP